MKYNTTYPKYIDIGKINVPVAMFMARDDKISDLEDNLDVKEKIKTVVHFRVIENEDHLSFSMSNNLTYF